MKNLIYVLASVFIAACGDPLGFVPPAAYSITFNNNLDRDIKVLFAIPGYGYVYPDTVLTSFEPFLKEAPVGMRFLDSKKPFEDLFRDDLPKDTLSIYIFNKDTLGFYPWDTIANRNLVEKRLDFSLSDLQNLNFIINYP